MAVEDQSRTVALSSSDEAPRTARAVIRELCTTVRATDDATETALLLTSELVTNAVVHAAGDTVMAVSLHRGRIRVSVTDRSPAIPVLSERRGEDEVLTEGGRGLMLVAALATGWGTQRQPDGGKSVWFDLDLD